MTSRVLIVVCIVAVLAVEFCKASPIPNDAAREIYKSSDTLIRQRRDNRADEERRRRDEEERKRREEEERQRQEEERRRQQEQNQWNSPNQFNNPFNQIQNPWG